MTPVEDEPLPAAALTVLAVHGLPDRDSNPRDQLQPIREALQLDPSNWHDHVWCPITTGVALGRVALRLGDEQFPFAAHCTDRDPPYTDRNPEPFVPWFQKQVAGLAPSAPVVIIAYSAGAFLVYKWLATRATADDVRRLSAIVCLAGPYWFAQPEQEIVFAHNPDRPIMVREEPIDPTVITRFLRPGQLITLLASNDITVLPPYASLRSAIAEPFIDEQEIAGAEHHTICGHPDTAAYLRARLLSLSPDNPSGSPEAVTLGEPETW